jgi:hypothetical protein
VVVQVLQFFLTPAALLGTSPGRLQTRLYVASCFFFFSEWKTIFSSWFPLVMSFFWGFFIYFAFPARKQTRTQKIGLVFTLPRPHTLSEDAAPTEAP